MNFFFGLFRLVWYIFYPHTYIYNTCIMYGYMYGYIIINYFNKTPAMIRWYRYWVYHFSRRFILRAIISGRTRSPIPNQPQARLWCSPIRQQQHSRHALVPVFFPRSRHFLHRPRSTLALSAVTVAWLWQSNQSWCERPRNWSMGQQSLTGNPTK